MAMNIDRWFKYAQAKLNDVVRSTNKELDELEAQREAEVADKPWLSSDAENPSFSDAKARIEWESNRQEELNRQAESRREEELRRQEELRHQATQQNKAEDRDKAEQQGEAEDRDNAGDELVSDDPRRDGSDPASDARDGASQPGSGTTSDVTFSPPLPSSGDESEIAAAKIELERREREAANRLEAIRNELGIDPPQP